MTKVPMTAKDKKYSEREAQRRFMAALKVAVTRPPKPLKDIPKRSGESRAVKGKKKRG